jgi:hypothetical protein
MSVVCNCCWSSPAQSFSSPNTSGLMTMFYCLRFVTPRTCRARSPYLYPSGTGWPGYTSSTGFLFRRLVRLAGLRWRYSIPPPHESTTDAKVTMRLTICQSVSKSWYRTTSGARDQIFITVWQLRSYFCGALSLTRGRVCRLSESLPAVVSHLS